MSDARRPLEALRAFARAAPPRERCELCAASLDRRHEHLLDPSRRDVRCACAECAFLEGTRQGSPWKRVPDRAERLALDLEGEDWASLGLPVDIAFFLRSGERTLALYPSPAGPVESLLPLDSWQSLVAKNPVLGKLEADVEALLVDRRRGARETWRVSIDRCYRLVGLMRRSWRGFSGGSLVARELEKFFAELEEESRA
jgi:hypothetical protein